jgi:tetratricopeptide (TPR) repeat protein
LFANALREHPGLVGADLDLPDEIYGFGSWLLWVLATRAQAVVDQAVAVGPARPSRHYGMVDGHPVPTPSLVAWLLTAAEFDVELERLAHRDPRLDERQKVLRTVVSRAIGGEPRLFKDRWLQDLAQLCQLGEPELQFLLQSRDDEGYVVDTAALRKAIARTLRTRPSAAHGDAGRLALASPPVLAQLPPLVTGFTGRAAELTALTRLLDPAAAEEAVVVSAVAGLAGVGKTALAVQAGHAARQRGWFAGGVLFIDLHGYDEAPVEPGQALDTLLRSLGVSADHIPPGAEERAGAYRSSLAAIDEPVLVIADNASSEAQVRLLRPGPGPHRMVVTSRHTLAGLGARLLDVAVLSQDDGVALLEAALRAARPDDDRASSESEAAMRLAQVCGGLPLALQIVAALLKADPTRSVVDLAEELAAERGRLEALRYDDGSGAAAPSVAAAFGLSCRRLDETAARLFRTLSVNPGPDVSTAAVAVLADLPEGQARAVLANLARAHLIDGAGGRWRMHDLLRLYSQQLSDAHAEADRRDQARDRLLRYYMQKADAADDHLRAPAGTAGPADFPDRDAALAWLDAERLNLVAAVPMAASTGGDEIAMRLPHILAMYCIWRRWFDDWLMTLDIGLEAARRVGDRRREAMTFGNLANALWHVRRSAEALAASQDALAIFREIGDRHLEGTALNNVGLALHREGRSEEAVTAYLEAIAILRETGDRRDEGMVLGNIGNPLQEVGRFEEAGAACRESVTIYRETGDQNGEADALEELGTALRRAGRIDEAVAAGQEAVATFRKTGDRHHEGMALSNLGLALHGAGRSDEAVSACQEAVAIYREAGDQHYERVALRNLEAVLAGYGGGR